LKEPVFGNSPNVKERAIEPSVLCGFFFFLFFFGKKKTHKIDDSLILVFFKELDPTVLWEKNSKNPKPDAGNYEM